jgi:LemA protein
LTLAVIIAAAVVLAIAIFVWLTYNRLVRLQLATSNSWAQIEVALKLRHDLVPALVQTVSGYASHERDTFERTAVARSAAVGASGSGRCARAPWREPWPWASAR